VLGSGIDVIYPREHRGLAERVVAAGTLLSERAIGAAPLAANFPARNRILAGMTQGTVVIEAAERSGSLITARLANESDGRSMRSPVASIRVVLRGASIDPGRSDPRSRRRGRVGADCARTPCARRPSGRTIDGRDLGEGQPADMEILELLAGGAVSVDELIRNSGRPFQNSCICARFGAPRSDSATAGTTISADGRFAGVEDTVRESISPHPWPESRHRRIACKGENIGEIPRPELHREGFSGSRRGSSEVEARVDIANDFKPDYAVIHGKSKDHRRAQESRKR